MTKVFVGSLNFSIGDEDLREYFDQIGEVISAKVMTEGDGGRSRGFGFVEFSSSSDAKEAIEKLNGSVWEGRVIKVCEERTARGRDSSENESSSDGDGDDSGRSAPTGYFRAQPFELVLKKRRKQDYFVENPAFQVDYKDAKVLSRFMSERGRILPRRMTGLTAANQRSVTRAIKRAQFLALLPYVRQ